jgi:beta-lactamase regulating signal transducer with metallopeptidase domain
MTHPAIPLSPDVVRSLGWALLHFVWQGAALAAALSVLMVWCRTASTRYALSVGALLLMVASPVVTFLLLSAHPHPYVAWTGTPSGAASWAWVRESVATAPAAPAVSPSRFQSDGLLWLVELWFAGVVLLSLRASGGFFLIERLKRRGNRPVSSELRERCQALKRRLGIDRAVRFCETQLVAAPAVIGLFRPVVLLPVRALTGLSEPQLEAVIAHELAHIRRLDSFVNLFQVGVETLLFYHPAVWWVSRRIRVEREHCCDDEAIRACGDAVEYARALTLMEERRCAPILAMGVNRTPLAGRVLRLLGLEETRGGLRSAGFATGLLCLAAALIAGDGFWGVARPWHGSPALPKQSPAMRHAPGDALRPALNNRPILANGETAGSPVQASSQEAASGGQNAGGEGSSTASQGGKEGFIEQMRAAGLKDLTVDQVIALKIQGVTAGYVKEMRAIGVKLTPEQLVAMRIQGVTADYVKALQAAGLKNLSSDDYIAARIQGITPEFLEKARQHGFQNLTLDKLMQLKNAGVL